MTDYGRAVEFGFFPEPRADRFDGIVERVLLAERLGLDLIGIQDHPYQARCLDTFTLIGALVARTNKIRFFPDVANLPLRPPALLAKATASLDLISGGRMELGLGAGGFWRQLSSPRRAMWRILFVASSAATLYDSASVG